MLAVDLSLLKSHLTLSKCGSQHFHQKETNAQVNLFKLFGILLLQKGRISEKKASDEAESGEQHVSVLTAQLKYEAVTSQSMNYFLSHIDSCKQL